MAVETVLFRNTSARSQSKNLVECKAGKLTLEGKMMRTHKRKGLLYIYKSDDSLMHFCWKDRTTGTVEDDFIIFPDDCEFKRVTRCPTGRVYVLKFKSSRQKFFFWVQEPKTDKNDEICRRIIEVINNPPAPESEQSGGPTPGETSEMNVDDEGDRPWRTCGCDEKSERLMEAAEAGRLEDVRRLLSEGAIVSYAGLDQYTPLHYAACKGHAAVVAELISAGAPLDARNTDSATPLQCAAVEGHRDVLSALIKAGANVNPRCMDGVTPLHLVARYGYVECIEDLLAAGANCNATDAYGNTPLHEASYRNREQCVRVLLRAGADASSTNYEGKTPKDITSSSTIRALFA